MFGRQQSQPADNDLLGGRYRLQKQLGEGGAGIIYQATDEQLGRVVAIKLLMSGAAMSADKQARFRSEARSVARLNHPNIVTLFDYIDTESQPYLVLEYIPGQDLWALDNSYSPNLMPFEVSLPIIDGILAALEYSHRHDVIHRDLKPENVMITPEMQVKVMDFGLARIKGQSRLTQEGLVAGTASYLAPELALGEAGDHRVDLYAAGVIMYELVSGRRPFSGDDPLAVISQHIHAPVVPPQRYNPNIPDDLQQIISTLLAKQPDDRYDSAADVRRDLTPIQRRLEGDGPAVERDGSGRRVSEAYALENTTTHQVLLDRIARGKMVGRETEVEDLKYRWDMARMGQPDAEPLVLISGEAGIGKTRLLREFQVYANLRDGFLLEGTARERDAGTPYALFTSVLRSYVREQPADVLRRQTPGFIAGEVVKLAPALAEKLGYIAPNPPLEPEAERARLLEQISGFILNIAAQQPTLLLLDDLHFADPGSLSILETLLRRAISGSLLVVGAYRDVALSYTHPVNHLIAMANTGDLIHELPLRRLSRDGVEQLLLALLGDSVSEEFADSIYRATEGNPLFVEEVIKGLAVDGQIRLRDGHWEQRDTGRLNVPGSIKSVLGGRLERVKKATRELLQLAAVIGRSFPVELLAEAGSHDDETIQWAIEEALRFQLIEVEKIIDQPVRLDSTGYIGIEYQFQHALIRETLYDEMRPLRRRQLHRRVAAATESLVTQGGLTLKPAVLAYHLIEAAQEEQAVPYLRQAGQAAYAVYANTEAVDYFSQAREILEDVAIELSGWELDDNLGEQFELLNDERTILNLMGNAERELLALERLQNLAEELDDKQRWVEVMVRLAAYYWQVGKLNQAEEITRRALNIAQTHDDMPGALICFEQIARIFWTRRKADSLEFATTALSLARELGDRQREGRLTELIGHIYTDTLNDVERGALYYKQALKICRETGNRFEEAWTLWGMGGLAMLVDDFTGALERYGQAKQISEAIGANLQVGWDVYRMGDAHYNLGNYDQALANYEEAQRIFDASHHIRGKIYVLISLGLLYSIRGANEEALTYLEQSKRQAEERRDVVLMLRSYQALSACYRASGQREDVVNAIRLANHVIKLATQGDHFEHELLGYYLRGAGFFKLRDYKQAADSSSQAINHLAQLSHLHSPQISVAEIYYQHSRIMRTTGQTAAAQEYLEKAYTETMRKANFIVDDEPYQNFLDNVPLNRAILNEMGSQ